MTVDQPPGQPDHMTVRPSPSVSDFRFVRLFPAFAALPGMTGPFQTCPLNAGSRDTPPDFGPHLASKS